MVYRVLCNRTEITEYTLEVLLPRVLLIMHDGVLGISTFPGVTGRFYRRRERLRSSFTLTPRGLVDPYFCRQQYMQHLNPKTRVSSTVYIYIYMRRLPAADFFLSANKKRILASRKSRESKKSHEYSVIL